MEPEKKNFKLISGKNTRVLLPNMFTLVGVCIGLSSIKFAFDGNFQLSVISIIIAAILDGLVGRVARLIKGCFKGWKGTRLFNRCNKFWSSSSVYNVFLEIK